MPFGHGVLDGAEPPAYTLGNQLLAVALLLHGLSAVLVGWEWRRYAHSNIGFYSVLLFVYE